MADYMIKGETLTGIADALRSGLGDIGSIKGDELEERVLEVVALIGTGGSGDDLSEVNAVLDEINGEMIGAKTVTFMVEGLVYATKLVAPGDTASKPNNPKTYYTDAEVFTFAGWSLEDDGTVDADALKNVTEDRTVYAVFTASPRYYTVKFYDDDGTFFKSESIAYGKSSTYTVEKKGALFQNWNPAPVNITGDLDCYAVWEYVAFTNDDWATIKEVAQTHNSAAVYSLGDERELTLNYADGTTETVLLEVGEFEPGVELVDGEGNVTGTAGMTVRLKTPLAAALSYMGGDWALNNGATICYPESAVCAYLLDTVLPALPAELRAVLSVARREYEYYAGLSGVKTSTADLRLWLLTDVEARAMSSADRTKSVYGTETPVSWDLATLTSLGNIEFVSASGSITSYLTKDDMNSANHNIVFEFYL